MTERRRRRMMMMRRKKKRVPMFTRKSTLLKSSNYSGTKWSRRPKKVNVIFVNCLINYST